MCAYINNNNKGYSNIYLELVINFVYDPYNIQNKFWSLENISKERHETTPNSTHNLYLSFTSANHMTLSCIDFVGHNRHTPYVCISGTRYVLNNNLYSPYFPYLPATESLSLFAHNLSSTGVDQSGYHRIYDLRKGK